MRILLAEDEPDLREITIKRLRAAGFGADGCPDGEEALYYLEHTEYDVAILDIMMPNMDGLTVLRTLRSRGSQIPVLLLTARDSVGDRVGGLDAGADDYLTKPFEFEELAARIRALLRRRSPEKTDAVSVGDLTVEFSATRELCCPGHSWKIRSGITGLRAAAILWMSISGISGKSWMIPLRKNSSTPSGEPGTRCGRNSP